MNEDAPVISEITLHALTGTPLFDEQVRQMVIATARAIAERQGIRIAKIDAASDQITIQVCGEEIIAVGLVTELRQLTNNWYRHQFGVESLWGS